MMPDTRSFNKQLLTVCLHHIRSLSGFQEGSDFSNIAVLSTDLYPPFMHRVAWAIRDELIPLFGCVLLFSLSTPRLTCMTRPNFPSTCLSPDQPGFGQVVPSGQVRRRSRKSTQNSIMQVSPSPSSWTVVTTNSGLVTEKSQWSFRPSDFQYGSNQPSAGEVGSFGPSRTGHPPSAYRRPLLSTKVCLSVDTRSLYPEVPPYPELPPSYHEHVRLPPIKSMGDMSPKSPYALPPISAIEDLRSGVAEDSAAVLRRLRMDDDYPNSNTTCERPPWERRPYAPSSSP